MFVVRVLILTQANRPPLLSFPVMSTGTLVVMSISVLELHNAE